MHKLIKYMITDPAFSIDETIKAIQKHKPDFLCYRNKEYFDKNEIIKFANFAKKFSKIFINYDSLEDHELLKFFDGIHLPSSKLNKISEFKNKIIIASTHNIDEVKRAKEANFITFSPVFNSKNRKGLGIEKLNKICSLHKNVIALGGIISEKEVEKIKTSNAIGFASIRYFFT
jgi:thiamine-phosphate pyrophosphorylase